MDNCQPLLDRSPEVSALCKPLERELGLNYFNYVKLVSGEKRTLLTNRPDYIGNFYNDAQYKDENVVNIEQLKFQSCFTWDQFREEPTFHKARVNYQIANGLTLIKCRPAFTELYYFGTKRDDPNASAHYLNKLDMLEHFIAYFKDRGSDLIDFADDHYVALDGSNNVIENMTQPENILNLLALDEDYRLAYDSRDDSKLLSIKEGQCAAYLMLQLTADEIAKQMRLSVRTVDHYIEHIKTKVQCQRKEDLVSKLFICDVLDDKNQKRYPLSYFPDMPEQAWQDYLKATQVKHIHVRHHGEISVLSQKESICLFLFCLGYSAKGIGAKIFSSYRTVQKHLSNVYKKLKVTKRSELNIIAVKNNLLETIYFAFPEALNELLH